MLQAREIYHANSIPRARNVNGSRKMVKKATKEQLDYQEKFNKMNSEWQAAAQEALKNGQTPQDYNSFSKAHGGVSSGSFSDGSFGSGSSSPSSSNDDSSDDNSSSKSDSVSSEKAADASKSNKSQKAQSNSNSDSGSQSDKSDESNKDEESKPSASTSSQAPKKTPTKNKDNGNNDDSNNSGSGILSGLKNIISGGEGTFYNTGLGSCGETNSDTDYIVAVSAQLMDKFSTGNPNTNPLCGKKIKVEYQGKEVEATIKDTCPPCSYSSIDFSPAAFNQLSQPEVGRIHGLKWAFLDGTSA